MSDTVAENNVRLSSSQATYTPSRESEVCNSAENSGPALHPQTQSNVERSIATIVGAQSQDLSPHSPSSDLFIKALKRFQEEKDQDFRLYEDELKTKKTKDAEIESFDWDDLDVEYEKAIAPWILKENDIMKRFDQRFKHFQLWMQVSNERESTRALKRLKTQAMLVQNSETELEKQEQHYARVMEAFQGAMQLLSQQSR